MYLVRTNNSAVRKVINADGCMIIFTYVRNAAGSRQYLSKGILKDIDIIQFITINAKRPCLCDCLSVCGYQQCDFHVDRGQGLLNHSYTENWQENLRWLRCPSKQCANVFVFDSEFSTSPACALSLGRSAYEIWMARKMGHAQLIRMGWQLLISWRDTDHLFHLVTCCQELLR